MNTTGFRVTISHTGEPTSFVRVLATVVNPTPLHLASTLRGDGTVRCTFMLRNRQGALDGLLVEDVLQRIGVRYDWSDVELITATGSPVEIDPGVMTAA
jgi:hypothetical protein